MPTNHTSSLKSNGACDPYWHRKWTTVAQFSALMSTAHFVASDRLVGRTLIERSSANLQLPRRMLRRMAPWELGIGSGELIQRAGARVSAPRYVVVWPGDTITSMISGW
jgi:hypothetical protein